MKLSAMHNVVLALAVFALIALAADGAPIASPQLPNPTLEFFGYEFYEAGGKKFTRYKYGVHNRAAYPNELFTPSPELPPCGANTKAARTWVDFYELNGRRLNGFCALGSPDHLNQIWFALEREAIPPSWIYIEMTDRKTNSKYKSNLAETTQ